MSLTDEQIAARNLGMSASEVAAVCGLHPYDRPIDVFARKMGFAPPRPEIIATAWGHKLEPMIRDDYAERHNVRVEIVGTLRRRDLPWWLATPDGLVYPLGADRADRGLEIKAHDRDALRWGGLEYGKPGTDEVPAHELVQCQWGMGATGLPRWDLVAFLGGKPTDYRIDRDDELIGMLRERVEKFLVDHIRTGIAPSPDGSESWDRWVKHRHPKHDPGSYLNLESDEIEEAAEIRRLIDNLRDARARLADDELASDSIEQKIKMHIGSREGIAWADGVIRWKNNRDSTKTDYEAAARDMRASAALASHGIDAVLALVTSGAPIDPAELVTLLEPTRELIANVVNGEAIDNNTKTKTGARPFTVPRNWKSPKKKWEPESK